MKSPEYICSKCNRKFYDLPINNTEVSPLESSVENLFWFFSIFLDLICFIFEIFWIAVYIAFKVDRRYKKCPFCGHKSIQKPQLKTKT